ncbi:hypothetical protein ACU4GI_35290 [Cupriavidus basilensis]
MPGKITPRSDARAATLAVAGSAVVFFMRSGYTTVVDTWTQVLPTVPYFVPLGCRRHSGKLSRRACAPPIRALCCI